jgi:hypothetical protein
MPSMGSITVRLVSMLFAVMVMVSMVCRPTP